MNIAPDIVNATTFQGLPELEPIPGTRLKRLKKEFWAYSVRLKAWILIPAGFVYDEESTPWRGRNPIAGLIHDYLSRKNAVPAVSKWKAAMVYHEFQTYEDALASKIEEKQWYGKAYDYVWRGLKAGFVGVCPDCVYWHMYDVEATVEEILA